MAPELFDEPAKAKPDMPEVASLKCNQVVLMVDLAGPLAHLNGKEGTLIKRIGGSKWAVRIPDVARSQVMDARNLRAQREAAISYSIVGSWDDWEVHEMKWDMLGSCFGYTVQLDGSEPESFKILRQGEWDSCVYPDRMDASPYDDHEVLGPDSGGQGACWTIGNHMEDSMLHGETCFKVRLLALPDGTPTLVTWDRVERPPPEPRSRGSSASRSRGSSASRSREASQASGRSFSRVFLEEHEDKARGRSGSGGRGARREEQEGKEGDRPRSALKKASSLSRHRSVSFPDDMGSEANPRSASRSSARLAPRSPSPGLPKPIPFEWTGDREKDQRNKRIRDNRQMLAAEVAYRSVRRAGDEGRFEVVEKQVAVRSGPSTDALTIACAKLGDVLRGTPHEVREEEWLRIDQEALRRLGATAYTDPGDQVEFGWMLMDATHLGLGRLLEPTNRPEMLDYYEGAALGRIVARNTALQLQREKVCTRDDPFGLQDLERAEKRDAHPGRTTCAVCGWRAVTAEDRKAHMRRTGHQDGFWHCAGS